MSGRAGLLLTGGFREQLIEVMSGTGFIQSWQGCHGPEQRRIPEQGEHVAGVRFRLRRMAMRHEERPRLPPGLADQFLEGSCVFQGGGGGIVDGGFRPDSAVEGVIWVRQGTGVSRTPGQFHRAPQVFASMGGIVDQSRSP